MIYPFHFFLTQEIQKKIIIDFYFFHEGCDALSEKLLSNNYDAIYIGYHFRFLDKETFTKQFEIILKNSDPRQSNDHTKTLITIRLDDTAIELLQKQDLTPSSVPAKNVQILLRDNSNISTGGDSIDYTDKVHPNINKIATEVIRAMPGLPYVGFDFLTPDITKDPYEVGYTVIKINDSPMISMHHEPYEGNQRNVSAKIIDLLFE